MKNDDSVERALTKQVADLRAEAERLKGRYEGLGDGADGETVQMLADQREEIRALRAEVERLKKEAVISVELVALSNSHVRVVWDLVLDLGKEVNALRAKLAKAEEALEKTRSLFWEGGHAGELRTVDEALAAIREEKP